MRKPDYNRRVVVTGLGVISPVGNDVRTAWDNLVRGRSGLGEITRFDISRYEHKAAGEVKDFDATQWLDAKAARRERGEPALSASRPPSRQWPTRASRSPTPTGPRSASSSAPGQAASS